MRQSRKKWERRREVHRNKLAAVIFVIMMIAFCVVNLATGDREFSATENRALEQRPELTISGIESGRWMEQYESYVSDQFAGRDFWVMLKSRVDLLAGKRKANGVFKGKDHYLLEDIAKPDEDQMKENLSAMKMFQKQYKDIPMYMMLVPNAANIESDKLPGYAVTENQEKQFKAIHSTLGSVYTWVDVSDILKKHRSEEIYYHTDHHWTTLGAYYGYQALSKSMKLDTSKTFDMKPYAVTNAFNGTLASTSGYETGYDEPIYIYAPDNLKNATEAVVNNVNEKKKTATLYDTSKLKGKDKYALFLGGNYPILDIKTTADSTDRLLIIKDSYANSLIPFLIPYYREIVVVDPRYYYDDIEKVMKKDNITSVLFLYNGNTFVKDNSISLGCYRMIRLNKYLSEAGVCSRREADRLIEAGVVTVDGKNAVPGMKVEDGQEVCVGKKRIKSKTKKTVLAVYKPAGIVCTEDKREKKNIIRFLNYPLRVTYAGRLDKDSEGLLIMTNDGDLINGMMRARFSHEKEYKVTVNKEITPEFIEKMSRGVHIRDREKNLDAVTRPCKVRKNGKYTFSIILKQGLNRQIRRMCEALGYKVTTLKRIRIMNVELGNLKPGEVRGLTEQELKELYGTVKERENERTGQPSE